MLLIFSLNQVLFFEYVEFELKFLYYIPSKDNLISLKLSIEHLVQMRNLKLLKKPE